ncbi:MAG: hypothetical protein R6V19_16290 [Armatimonadota bacterium]
MNTSVRDVLRAMAAAALIPFLILAVELLAAMEGTIKAREQGWRYLIPTWGGIGDVIQFASLLAAIAGAVLLFEPDDTWVIGGWMFFWVFIPGLYIPYKIAVYGDSKDREKVISV